MTTPTDPRWRGAYRPRRHAEVAEAMREGSQMSDPLWSPEEIYDSVGSRGLEAMVDVTVRKEGLTETEARAKAEEFFTTHGLDRATGVQTLSDEQAKAEVAELNAEVARWKERLHER